MTIVTVTDDDNGCSGDGGYGGGCIQESTNSGSGRNGGSGDGNGSGDGDGDGNR